MVARAEIRLPAVLAVLAVVVVMVVLVVVVVVAMVVAVAVIGAVAVLPAGVDAVPNPLPVLVLVQRDRQLGPWDHQVVRVPCLDCDGRESDESGP